MQPAMTARRLLLAIALLAVAGIAVSSVSLYHHYGTDQSSYCDFGQMFNCDIVNRSSYSESTAPRRLSESWPAAFDSRSERQQSITAW